MIVANKPYTNQLYLQNSTWFLFTFVYFDTTVYLEVQLIKSTLKQTKFEDKTVKSTLALVNGLHDFPDFPDRTRMCQAWKWETYVRSQSFSSESAVKYLHVGRRKIQISPPPGEQHQLNALPQGQQRQSNPHPHALPPPPRRLNIDRCITFYLNSNIQNFLLLTEVICQTPNFKFLMLDF